MAASLTVLFWNVHRKDLAATLARLIVARKVDLIFYRAHGPRGQNVRAVAENVAAVGGDPVELVRERFGLDEAAELERARREP